jgi:hypothetical protein
MAKPLRGEKEITLGGEKFTLRLALGQLEELEAQLGTGIVAVAMRFTNGQARLTDAHAILRQGFAGAKIKITEARLSDLIDQTGMAVLSEAASLLLAVLTDDIQGNAEAAGEETVN